MITVTDPTDCTKLNRTQGELEEWAVFCMCVAGKNARTIQKALERFWGDLLEKYGNWKTPFELIRIVTQGSIDRWQRVANRLKKAGVGCHTLKGKAVTRLAYHEARWLGGILAKYPVVWLEENIYGWGPKTARYFVLHSRKNQRCVPLDTHVLKYLSSRGVPNVPKSTPSAGKQYKKFEDHFLFFYDTMADKTEFPTVADFDLAIWNLYSKRRRS